MRVFRTMNDVNRYQYFLNVHQQDVRKLLLDCTPKGADWTPPPVFVYKPRHVRGDFFQFGGEVLITSPRATAVLMTHLEMAGELLPLPFEGEDYTVLNVTECVNCLDAERTEWSLTPDGRRIRPLRYVFHPDRLPESPLFKIPETCRGEVLLAEGVPGCETEEFRAVADAAGLRGLVYQELWNDED